MGKKTVSRRDFIKAAGVAAGAGVLTACAPQTVIQTQVVRETSVVVETQIVNQTQIVSEVVTATPAPTAEPDAAVMDIWAITTVEDLNAEWTSDPENEEFKKQWWTGGMIREQARAFLEKHPGVTLKITGHNWDWALRQNQYLAWAAGIRPDTSYGEAYVSEFVSLDLYSPVSDAVRDMFPEGTYRAALKDGKAYGLAETTGTNVLFVNLDVVEKVGLDPEALPTTWPELLEFANTMSDGNGGSAYFTYTPHANNFGIALRMGHWWAQNGTPIGSDLGVPSFNTEGAADVWLFHNELMYTTSVDDMLKFDAAGEGPGGSTVSFDEGVIGLKVGWNNDATYIKAPARAIEFPIPEGGQKATIQIGNQINSPVKDGPNPELAIEYIELSTTDEAAQLLKPNGCGIWLPALTSMLEQYETFDKLGGYPEAAHDNVRVTMKAALDGGAGPLPGWPKSGDRIWNAWNESYGRIWQGNLDKDAIQAELDTLQTTAEGLVNA